MPSKHVSPEELVLELVPTCSELLHQVIQALSIRIVELKKSLVLEILVIAACGEQRKALRDKFNDLGSLLGVIHGGSHQHVEELDVLGLEESGALIFV